MTIDFEAEPVTATTGNPEDAKQWTAKSAGRPSTPFPQRMMPTPAAYVASWIYVFGVITVAALAVIILTGCILALKAPVVA